MNKNTNANQSSVMNTRNTNMRPVQTTIIRNTSSGNVSKGYSGSNVLGIVLLVVIIILIAGACYWAYTVYSSKTFQTSTSVEVLADVKNASSKFAIGSGSIPNSKYSNEYSISMWLNILDYTYNYGKEKVILRRGTAGSSNLEIVLGDKHNDLIVRIKQQGPTPSSAMTVSKFADVAPIDINTGYIHGTDGNPYIGNSNIISNGGKAFEKISGNQIDYPTIKYDIASGCDNALNTMKPDEAMTIMIEQSFRMKEGFNKTSYNGDLQQLGRIDTAKISDNSAPVESQVLHNSYFNMVSGNNVIPNINKERYSNIPSFGTTKENFTPTDDLINAFSAVMIDLCNIMNVLKSQKHANDDIDTMNSSFQKIINILEQGRKNSTIENINETIDAELISLMENNTSNNEIMSLFEKLITDIQLLEELTSNPDIPSDLPLIQNAVNTKLATANCPLTLNGTTELDATVNLYQNFINLLKKSIYTYINNLGVGIRKTYTDLSTSQNANCIIDSNLNKDPTVGTCIYKMLPLQKWVHVIVSVYNQVVDIYIDGQLASSCVLKGFPAISTDDVDITPDGGFSGQISRVAFSNTAMTVPKAQSLYYDGPVPSTSLFSMIPTWVWYGIILLVAVAIIYSIFM